MVWYGIVEFNIPLDFLTVDSDNVKYEHNAECFDSVLLFESGLLFTVKLQ